MWWIHIVLRTRSPPGEKIVFFFFLSDRSDLYMTDSQSLAVDAFASRVLISFSVDETLLPRYVNLSTSFSKPPPVWRCLLFYFDHSTCSPFCLHWHGGLWRLVPSPDYAAGIQAGWNVLRISIGAGYAPVIKMYLDRSFIFSRRPFLILKDIRMAKLVQPTLLWILWHINLSRLFNAKSIFIHIISHISNNSV